jgi:hypothetical protein
LPRWVWQQAKRNEMRDKLNIWIKGQKEKNEDFRVFEEERRKKLNVLLGKKRILNFKTHAQNVSSS